MKSTSCANAVLCMLYAKPCMLCPLCSCRLRCVPSLACCALQAAAEERERNMQSHLSSGLQRVPSSLHKLLHGVPMPVPPGHMQQPVGPVVAASKHCELGCS